MDESRGLEVEAEAEMGVKGEGDEEEEEERSLRGDGATSCTFVVLMSNLFPAIASTLTGDHQFIRLPTTGIFLTIPFLNEWTNCQSLGLIWCDGRIDGLMD